MAEYWGYHLLLDCRACNIDSITSKENLANFVKELVKEIDMVAYGDPILEHFATHDADKAGYSLVQLIETSSITGHFVDKTGDAYLDIFSCKPFELDDALRIVIKYFNPKIIQPRFLKRQA